MENDHVSERIEQLAIDLGILPTVVKLNAVGFEAVVSMSRRDLNGPELGAACVLSALSDVSSFLKDDDSIADILRLVSRVENRVKELHNG